MSDSTNNEGTSTPPSGAAPDDGTFERMLLEATGLAGRATRFARTPRLSLDGLINRMSGMGVKEQDRSRNTTVDTDAPELSREDRQHIAANDGYVVRHLNDLVNAALRRGWYFQSGDDEYRGVFDAEDARLKLKANLRQALLHAFEQDAALIVMVLDEEGGDVDLTTPLDVSKVRRIDALHMFETEEFEPAAWELDPHDPNWSEVAVWQITPQNTQGHVGSTGVGPGLRLTDAPSTPFQGYSNSVFRIHASRCLYVPGRITTRRRRNMNNGKDRSYLHSLWDALVALYTVNKAGAESAARLQMYMLKVGGMSSMTASQAWSTTLQRIRSFATGLGLYGMGIVGSEDEVVVANANASGYDDLKTGAEGSWAAVTGQDRKQAFGETGGGLSSSGETERDDRDRRTNDLQETHLRPVLEAYYAIQIEVLSKNPSVQTDEAERVQALQGARLLFEPLEAKTDKAKVDQYRHQAEADMMYIREGVYTPEEIREARSRGVVGFPVVRGRVAHTGITTPALAAVATIAAVDPEAAANIALALLRGDVPDWPDTIKQKEPLALPGAGAPTGPDGRAAGQAGKAKPRSEGGNEGKE